MNKADDLSIFENETFDFIYCHIVLQHVRPEFSGRYIEEFCRILKRGGMGYLQVPEMLERNEGDGEAMEMYGLFQREVFEILDRNRCYPLQVKEDGWCGSEVESYRYIFTKRNRRKFLNLSILQKLLNIRSGP